MGIPSDMRDGEQAHESKLAGDWRDDKAPAQQRARSCNQILAMAGRIPHRAGSEIGEHVMNITERNKQYQFVETGKKIRRRGKGLGKNQWRHLDGCLERMRAGELIGVTPNPNGIPSEVARAMVKQGHWNVIGWEQKPVVAEHPFIIGKQNFETAPRSLGWEIFAAPDGRQMCRHPSWKI